MRVEARLRCLPSNRPSVQEQIDWFNFFDFHHQPPDPVELHCKSMTYQQSFDSALRADESVEVQVSLMSGSCQHSARGRDSRGLHRGVKDWRWRLRPRHDGRRIWLKKSCLTFTVEVGETCEKSASHPSEAVLKHPGRFWNILEGSGPRRGTGGRPCWCRVARRGHTQTYI